MTILIRLKNPSKQDLEKLLMYLESNKLIYEIETETDFDENSQTTQQRQKEIERAKQTINSMTFNEREYFDSKQKVKRDEMAVLQTAIENAIDKGVHQSINEIAAQLKESNKYSIAEIMHVTGLTKEQIESL